MNQLDRMSCEQVFQRLDDYLDRELTPRETELVREHLAICEWCAGTYEFQEGVLHQLKERLQRVPVPSRLLEKISLALKREREDSSLHKGEE
jgi:anti-sigma factor (TIGR02949 family)